MRIGKIINGWRKAENINIRDGAAAIGILSSTLSRIENGENCDGETLAIILLWLLAAEPKTERK